MLLKKLDHRLHGDDNNITIKQKSLSLIIAMKKLQRLEQLKQKEIES